MFVRRRRGQGESGAEPCCTDPAEAAFHPSVSIFAIIYYVDRVAFVLFIILFSVFLHRLQCFEIDFVFGANLILVRSALTTL